MKYSPPLLTQSLRDEIRVGLATYRSRHDIGGSTMAQILNSADNAGSSIFDTVTRTVGSIDKSVTAADNALSVLVTTTSNWKDDAILDAAVNRMDRSENYVNRKAIAIAEEQDKIQAKLEANPRLNKLFRAIKERHKQTLKELQAAN